MKAGRASHFEPLDGQRHMSLVTYRRTGEPVATPIWFVEIDGRLYVRTAFHFGKLKRLANDRRVSVAPCTEDGSVTGEAVAGVARVLAADDPLALAADRALDEKYGDERTAMTKLLADQGWDGVFIEVCPPAEAV